MFDKSLRGIIVCLASLEFRRQVVDWTPENPIHAGYVIWAPRPNLLLNWFLQRTIIGLESFIPSAAFLAGSHYGRLDEKAVRGTREPFSLNCESVANTIYNCVPGLIDSNFRMKRARGRLWKSVSRFYREVRNPLFHGSQLETHGHKHGETLESVIKAFDLFAKVYNWTDWWMPPERLAMFGEILVSEPPKLEDLPPEE